MSRIVLVMIACLLPIVQGKYKSQHFIFKGNVAYSDRLPALKEISAPREVNTLSYCASQCRMHLLCTSIEMCHQKERTLCRLCNLTNSVFTDSGTNLCRLLELDKILDETELRSKGVCHDGWIQFQTNCYYFSSNTSTVTDAKLYEGFSFDWDNYQLHVDQRKLSLGDFLWIGVTWKNGNCSYLSDGRGVSMTNFYPGEPNNSSLSWHPEYCIELNKNYNGLWNDRSCNHHLRFVCESP